MVARLTAKQKKFVNEYLIDLNGTQAAIRAGYSKKTADRIASENLRKLEVQNYLQKRQSDLQKRVAVTPESVINELAAIGFADIADYVSVEEEIDQTSGIAYRYVDIKLTKDIPRNKRAAIAGIKQGAKGIEIKLYNKVDALVDLGNHLGLFNPNKDKDSDGEGNTGVVILPKVSEPEDKGGGEDG